MLYEPLYIGTTEEGKKVYITEETRKLHMQVIGASGGGKSKFLEYMIRQDILNNDGFCLLDPHGELYENIVNWCAAEGVTKWPVPRKVLLFDLTNPDWTLAFNPLHLGGTKINKLVDSMVKAVAKVWGGEDTDRTPTLKRCLRLLCHALAEHNLTLMEAQRLISVNDPTIRTYVANNLQDPFIRAEWQDMMHKSPKDFSAETMSTRNRLIEFFAAEDVRLILGQVANTIDFRKLMDEGYILLINLGGEASPLSEDNASLLGTLIINELFLRAKGRPKGSRPFYLYIDECYYYINEDIARILNEGRKFGLHLILAHQQLAQLLESGKGIHDAVMGGAQIKAVFRGLFPEDAEKMAEHLFLGELDMEKPKTSLNKPTVVDYEVIKLKGRSSGASWSMGRSSGSSTGRGTGAGQSNVEVSSYGDGGILIDASLAAGASESESDIDIDSGSSSEGEGGFDTSSESEALRPILKELPTSVYNLEELRYLAKAKLVRQPPRHAYVQFIDQVSLSINIPHVEDGWASEQHIKKFTDECYNLGSETLKYIIRKEDAKKALELREAKLLEDARRYSEAKKAKVQVQKAEHQEADFGEDEPPPGWNEEGREKERDRKKRQGGAKATKSKK